MSLDRMGGKRFINKGVLQKLIMARIVEGEMIFESNSRSYEERRK